MAGKKWGGNSNNRGSSTNRGGGQGGSNRQDGNNINRQGGPPTNTDGEQARDGHRGRGAPRGRSSDRGGRNPRGGSRGALGPQGGNTGGQGDNRGPPPSFYESDPQRPSQRITDLENQIVKNQTKPTAKSVSLGEGPNPIPRPEYGLGGETGGLWTNYFDLGDLRNIVLHQYIVTIKPEKPSAKHRCRRIFSLLLGHPDLADYPLATDYNDKLICPKPIERFEPAGNIEVRYCEEGEEPKSSYEIEVSSSKRFALSDLINDLSSSYDTYPDKEGAIQAMNTVLAAIPNTSSDIQAVGQSKHFDLRSTDRAQHLDGGLVAIKGYFHSVRPSVGRLLLNLNVSTSAFFRPGPLRTLVEDLQSYHKPAPLLLVLRKYLRKLRVTVNYLRDKDGKQVERVKTIHDVGAGRASQLRFEIDDGNGGKSKTTVQEHFKRNHNIDIANDDFCVNVGRSKEIYIPTSLCNVVPGQVARQKLLPSQTSGMITFACNKPADNARQITQSGLSLMGIQNSENGDNLLHKFGISPEKELLSVEARVLKQPKLRYKDDIDPGSQGSWNLSGKKFVNPITKPILLSSLCLRDPKQLDPTPSPQDFMQKLRDAMGAYGMAKPRTLGHHVIKPLERLEQTMSAVDSHMSSLEATVLVVILDSQDAAMYSFIKYCGDVKYGLKTLCICPKRPKTGNLDKLNDSHGYLANLCLKLNLKLGGTNHRLHDGPGIRTDTIYFGIDVTHPTGVESQKGAPSIAGVVANTDEHLGQWPASIRIQASRQEMVEGLRNMVRERLEAWTGSRRPTNILVYRDGVSESQYQAVLKDELPEIRKGAKEFYQKFGQQPPKITLVIVGKRHHTRFYPLKNSENTHLRNGNVIPGTVVDRKITMERGYDFFMVSHGGIQGTSRPAHYAVLVDEMKLGANKLQELTYHLCYIYGRSTTSVSIVPPAYYADRVCERARCYLYKAFHRTGTDSEEFDINKAEWNGKLPSNTAKSMFYM